MSSRKRIAALALSVLLVLSVVGPALAVAQDEQTATDSSDDGDLRFDVEQGSDDTLVITVYDDNGTVEGATVTVDTVDDGDDESENETESAEGTSEETDDEPSDDDESTYAGTGSYTTDGNGTVTIPAPDASVELVITVTDGDRTTTSEVRTNPGVGVPFGQLVQSFVQDLLDSDGNESIGQQVSAFVREHNPGNAPEHAGPPEDRGPENRTDRGPPEDRGPENRTDRGPPADAGNGGGPPRDEATPTPTESG
jgi:hypothetical protein